MRCREVARFFAEEPIDSWQSSMLSLIAEMRSRGDGIFCTSLISLGVCETLVARCSYPWEAGVVDLASMFSLLATFDEGAKRLNVPCTHELLAELFRVHILDEMAVFNGCSLVTSLSGADDEPGDNPVGAGLVEGVVAGMRAHPTSNKVSVLGTIAISVLADSNRPYIQLRLLNAGAVEVVKAAVLAFPDNESISKFGNKALVLLQRSVASILAPAPATVPAAATVPAPVTAIDPDTGKARPKTTALPTATATTTAKPAHLCVSSCCGQAATQRCAGCGLVWYCSREHQTGHWKQHKKVCKATDDVSVRCREMARFLAEEPVDSWQSCISSFLSGLQSVDEGIAYQSLVAWGVCETLVARTSFPWPAGVVTLSLLLCCLASVADGAKRLNVPCSYEVLAELFRAHTPDETIMYNGCSLVIQLLRAGDIGDKPVTAGLVEGVVAAMRAHATSAQVSMPGAMAITILADSSRPDLLSRLLNAGAVKALRAAILACPDDVNVRNFGGTVLLLLQDHAASMAVLAPAAAPVRASALGRATAP